MPQLCLTPPDDPRRTNPKPLGLNAGELIGLRVTDARHHIHVPGVTGAGKSTWLANLTVAEARAGRGTVLLDCQGDLARHVLDRLPAECADRLVILDPAETEAPPVWNILAPTGFGSGDVVSPAAHEYTAETLTGTFAKIYARSWGPRMDELFRAACLTLIRLPGATLADLIPLLTERGYHRRITGRYGTPGGLHGFWESYDALTDAQRQERYGPVISRLRSVLTYRFARDLLATPGPSTFDLSDILDGGILIARLPKGELGEHGVRLIGSLLLSGLWAAAVRRADRAPEDRPDATLIVDECHNFLHLPIGVDDALAEARGYRVCLVLAHQHLDQLPPEIRGAVDANARNKIVFTVSPDDATKLARHFRPYFDDNDLSGRPSYEISARILNAGTAVAPFNLSALPLPDAIPDRADMLRAAARARTGLSRAQRALADKRRRLPTTDPDAHDDRPPVSLPVSSTGSLPASLPVLEPASEPGTAGQGFPQVDGGER
ncbi:type IV secretory system conjugative DNA transfer family protein [Nocardia sp. NPDC059091]|uniref:type IV secretory system conjugative DNA transfer family protein n=1 Tax=unclassified Nocardia TaxID=2637762 RepID=UPI003691A5F8